MAEGNVFACYSAEAWRSKLQEAVDTKRLVILRVSLNFWVFSLNFVHGLLSLLLELNPGWLSVCFIRGICILLVCYLDIGDGNFRI